MFSFEKQVHQFHQLPVFLWCRATQDYLPEWPTLGNGPISFFGKSMQRGCKKKKKTLIQAVYVCAHDTERNSTVFWTIDKEANWELFRLSSAFSRDSLCMSSLSSSCRTPPPLTPEPPPHPDLTLSRDGMMWSRDLSLSLSLCVSVSISLSLFVAEGRIAVAIFVIVDVVPQLWFMASLHRYSYFAVRPGHW